MPDDKTESAPADRSRINVREEYEVQYWTKKFGCTPAELEKGFALRPLLITPSRAPKIDQVAQKRCNSHYGLYLSITDFICCDHWRQYYSPGRP